MLLDLMILLLLYNSSVTEYTTLAIWTNNVVKG